MPEKEVSKETAKEANKTVAVNSAKLAETAETLKDSAAEQADSADRRTELAANRTVLAAERTYAAWVRTGLAAVGAGWGMGALVEHHEPTWVGKGVASLLILLGGLFFAAAAWRGIRPGAMPPRPDVPQLGRIWFVAIAGAFMVVTFIALLSVWLA